VLEHQVDLPSHDDASIDLVVDDPLGAPRRELVLLAEGLEPRAEELDLVRLALRRLLVLADVLEVPVHVSAQLAGNLALAPPQRLDGGLAVVVVALLHHCEVVDQHPVLAALVGLPLLVARHGHVRIELRPVLLDNLGDAGVHLGAAHHVGVGGLKQPGVAVALCGELLPQRRLWIAVQAIGARGPEVEIVVERRHGRRLKLHCHGRVLNHSLHLLHLAPSCCGRLPVAG